MCSRIASLETEIMLMAALSDTARPVGKKESEEAKTNNVELWTRRRREAVKEGWMEYNAMGNRTRPHVELLTLAITAITGQGPLPIFLKYGRSLSQKVCVYSRRRSSGGPKLWSLF